MSFKNLRYILPVIALSLTSCVESEHDKTIRLRQEVLFAKSESRITAKVLAERYNNNFNSVNSQEGTFSYSNETTSLNSNYVIKCETIPDKRIIALNVLNGRTSTKESLELMIDTTSIISFPRGNLESVDGYWDPDETYFKSETQFGTKSVDRIKVENPK